MALSEGLISELAGAILDGTPIDWSAAESDADESDREVLKQLKLLAALVDLHSRPPLTSAGAEPTARDGSESFEWGHLRVLERVGGGAFGDVYRAWDARLDREVALKLLTPSNGGEESEPPVLREGRLLARVHHPNVVTIFGADQIGDQIGLWMEFVHGRTLKQSIDAGQVFSEAEAIRIGLDLCHAVAAVHAAGLLHRDIKAQNVMQAEDGRTVLMDFGTGRELADGSISDFTGTPLYLAPEILSGGDASVQSDIYSLGVLLHHLVSGSFPVKGRDLHELSRVHDTREGADVPASAELRPRASGRFARIVRRAIDPRPALRYQDAQALAADLQTLASRPRLSTLKYAMGAAIALTAALWLAGTRSGRTEINSPSDLRLLAAKSDALTIPERPVIAVLPLENLSAEPDSDYFVDGLTDEIIRNLATVDGLEVRSRTSSFAFKDAPRNLRQIGEQLGANLVVEGSVLRSDRRLRINVQMVQVAGDVPLWSERFDRELEDVFAVQDEISRAIVNKLRLSLGRGQRRYDTDVEVYELYLRARELVGRRGNPNLEEAAKLYQQVLVRDPAFAPAHAGLAIAWALISTPFGSTISLESVQAILRPAAIKAHDLDPLLADAHVAIGWMNAYDHKWSEAEKAFERAIALNPSLTPTYTNYAISTLEPVGKLEEALRILRVALRNDPLSLDVQREIGVVQFLSAQYPEAIETFRRLAAVDPEFPFVTIHLARALIFSGRPAEAIPLLEATDGRQLGAYAPGQGRRSPWLAQAYVMTGRIAEAHALAAEYRDAPSYLPFIYAALEDDERTFETLERVATARRHHLGRLLMHPELARLSGDSRLVGLRERFDLPR